MEKYKGFQLTPASKWVKLHPAKQEFLRSVGGFPVNDAFIPIWERPVTLKKQFLILYGTYGSSKTTDRIQELILECITDKYFKCFFGREIFDIAKKELHSSIVSTIENMGLGHLFEYSKKANGTKDIRCIVNDNVFKPFGCDDHESIKGWDNPTHVFIDEMNQISFKSFGMLQSRLRKMDAKKCFIGCFNNCDVLPDHWICTTLLNKEAPLVDDNGNEIKRNIIEHFSIYTDNYFLDHQDYKNALIEQAGHDPIRLDAILNGKWGVSTTGQPFYKQFNSNIHVGRCEYDPSLVLHVTWDENVNPYLPVSIWQIKGLHAYCIDEIAAKNPHNTLRWVCGEIVRRYEKHEAGMIIYGDATSRKDDVKAEKGKDFFVLCKEYLAHFNPKLRVGKSNPNVAMRGNFLNAVLGQNLYGLGMTISPVCKNMIADLQHTSESPDGTKDKTKEKVDGISGVQRWGHFSDGMDYMMCEAFYKYFYMFQHKGKSPKMHFEPRMAHNSY